MKKTIISIANNKGGVGKTTVTCNLAHALAKEGLKVLVADIDSQCNATTLLMTRDFSIRDSMYELLSLENEIDIQNCIYPTPYPNLHCLANVVETSGIEPDMIEDRSGEYMMRLRHKMRDFALENYDITIIDTPPNMGSFVLSALYASDFAIVPIAARSAFSLEGLVRAMNLIDRIHKNKNPDLRFLRLLINEVDRRTISSKASVEHIKASFPTEKIFQTMIPVNATFHQAEARNKTIIAHNFSSLGANAFRILAKELIADLQ